MARARDYAAEYRQRIAGARSAEERQYRAGHRGPAAFLRAVESGRTRSVVVLGKASDQIVATTTDDRGRVRHYILQRKPPEDARTARRADRQMNRMRDIIDDQVPDYIVDITP